MVIDDVDDEVIAALEARARRNGRSLDAEAHAILKAAAADERRNYGLGTAIANRFRGCAFDGEIEEFRGFAIRPASFEEESEDETK